jgi:hypothetical protein
MSRVRSKYKIWDKGELVPAWTRKPKNPEAKRLEVRTLEEAKLGICWYLPAQKRA